MVHHVCEFRLRTYASLDTQFSRALNTQLRIIAERTIPHSLVMDGQNFD